MDIMTHAKFHFNRLMSTLSFGIRASEPPPPPPLGPDERLKRPGLIGLISLFLNTCCCYLCPKVGLISERTGLFLVDLKTAKCLP